MVTEPTKEELLDGIYTDDNGIKSVHRTSTDDWRHGCSVCQVFHRVADDTYWSASYRVSTDGETHGLRDGDYDLARVHPVEKTVMSYEPVTTEEG